MSIERIYHECLEYIMTIKIIYQDYHEYKEYTMNIRI